MAETHTLNQFNSEFKEAILKEDKNETSNSHTSIFLLSAAETYLNINIINTKRGLSACNCITKLNMSIWRN